MPDLPPDSRRRVEAPRPAHPRGAMRMRLGATAEVRIGANIALDIGSAARYAIFQRNPLRQLSLRSGLSRTGCPCVLSKEYAVRSVYDQRERLAGDLIPNHTLDQPNYGRIPSRCDIVE